MKKGLPPLQLEAARARRPAYAGKPCPVSDLFGVRGRQLLARLDLPEPWQRTIEASLRLIDELDREIGECERELRRLGADHRYGAAVLHRPRDQLGARLYHRRRARRHRPLPHAAETRRLQRPLPARLPIGRARPARPARQARPRYLRWAAVEAATHACTAPTYRDRYQQTKTRIGEQRGAKVTQIDLARRLSEAIWPCSPASNPSLPKAPPTS